MTITASRPGGSLILVAAQALFLWMFLAADPLEQLAVSGALGDRPATRKAAFAFAAEWRHGMAANSPLYMPGFFAVAVATWLFGAVSCRREILVFVLGLSVALGIAFAAAPAGAVYVLAAFQAQTGIGASHPPQASARAMFSGLFTLVTWTAFVVGSRAAIARRSLVPLLPVPALTACLIALRPWTVDEFTSVWWRRASEGDLVALGSAALIPLLAGSLLLGSHGTTVSRSSAGCL